MKEEIVSIIIAFILTTSVFAQSEGIEFQPEFKYMTGNITEGLYSALPSGESYCISNTKFVMNDLYLVGGNVNLRFDGFRGNINVSINIDLGDVNVLNEGWESQAFIATPINRTSKFELNTWISDISFGTDLLVTDHFSLFTSYGFKLEDWKFSDSEYETYIYLQQDEYLDDQDLVFYTLEKYIPYFGLDSDLKIGNLEVGLLCNFSPFAWFYSESYYASTQKRVEGYFYYAKLAFGEFNVRYNFTDNFYLNVGVEGQITFDARGDFRFVKEKYDSTNELLGASRVDEFLVGGFAGFGFSL